METVLLAWVSLWNTSGKFVGRCLFYTGYIILRSGSIQLLPISHWAAAMALSGRLSVQRLPGFQELYRFNYVAIEQGITNNHEPSIYYLGGFVKKNLESNVQGPAKLVYSPKYPWYIVSLVMPHTGTQKIHLAQQKSRSAPTAFSLLWSAGGCENRVSCMCTSMIMSHYNYPFGFIIL